EQLLRGADGSRNRDAQRRTGDDLLRRRHPFVTGVHAVHLLYFASLNASMNFGTTRSRITSGPCSARYLPADSAASSAIGTSTSAAASQLLAAAEERIEDAPERREPFELASRLWDFPEPSCESARRMAYVAAPPAAAAAAAASAVFRLPPLIASWTCSVTGIAFPPAS